jgi:hypothetical protein
LSRRALIIALSAASLGLALAVGLLAGILVSRPTSHDRASHLTTVIATTSATGPQTGAPVLSKALRAVGSVNVACEYLDAADHYWVEAVILHGVSTGAIRESSTQQSIDSVESSFSFHEVVHTSLASAQTYDPRWGTLQRLVLKDETAVAAVWDGGGLKPVDAVRQVMVASPDDQTIHGECQAARSELADASRAMGIQPTELLRMAGATDQQVQGWSLGS